MSAVVPEPTNAPTPARTTHFATAGDPTPIPISVIEQQKENIQPLNSGRSASHLASLSSQSRSGLGLKLASEHSKFQTQLAAVSHYEREGSWPEGRDGLTSEEVAAMAEDPLDVHHQYARFVIGSYPAGASATSRLVPLLEQSTRLFLKDERYTNDPRYLRLWNLYAQKMEAPEDCYRFLFAKNIGDRLASLYEEYALVLEAAGKRQQAEQIYQLGIARSAAPLDRLKKTFNKFRERMLVAPPLPEPPATTATSSSSSRSILAGSGMQGLGAGTAAPANGAKLFDVFVDEAGDKGKEREGAQWEDLGTVKSRKRENDTEGTIWKGQTAPQTPGGTAGKPAPFKLEVFRDAAPTMSAPTTPSAKNAEAQMAGTGGANSEADALRLNPFKNYSAADVSLSALDPLASLPPPTTATTSTNSSSGKAKSSSSSSKKTKSSSSSSSAAAKKDGEKPTEFRTCDLSSVYPSPGIEYSFEELKCRKHARYREEVDSWNGWEWLEAWTEETRRTGKTSYVVDRETGWPLLYDRKTGEPLWEFLQRPAVEDVREAEVEVQEAVPAPVGLESPARATVEEPTELAPEPERPAEPLPVEAAAPPSPAPIEPAPLAEAPPSPAPAPIQQAQEGEEDEEDEDEEDEDEERLPEGGTGDSYAPLITSPVRREIDPHAAYNDPRRPPSPTMNTLEAQHLVDNMFAKTLDFGALTTEFANHTHAQNHDDDDEPDTDEEEEEDEEEDHRAHWADVPPSQLDAAMSQMTQGSSMLAPTQDDNAPFVPFSQTASQLDDSMFATQLSQVDEEDEERTATRAPPQQQQQQLGMAMSGGAESDDENAGVVQPMRLFRDAPPSTSNNAQTPATPAGFKPARAPLGAKPLGFKPSVTPAAQQPFAVFSDTPSLAEEEEPEYEGDDSFEEPLEGEEGEEPLDFGDGFAMGRRERGVPSKYAPFVDAMTPITERTMEIGSATRNMGALNQSQRSTSTSTRRESQFGAPAPVQEEDEDDTSSSEDGEQERNIVAQFEGQAGEAGESSSNSESEDDSDEPSTDEEEDEEEQMPSPGQHQLPQQQWQQSELTPAQFEGLAQAQAGAASFVEEQSFDRSLNTTLPEGCTITGNQSAMNTDMRLAATTAELSSATLSSSATGGDALEPVEAFSSKVIASLLARVDPPVFSHPNAHDRLQQTSNQLSALQKTAERREKQAKKAAKDRTGSLSEEAWELELDGETFTVYEKLGEGSFGAVFRVASQAPSVGAGGAGDDSFDLDAELAEDEEDSEAKKVAVKVEQPTNVWEWHVMQQLHARLDKRSLDSVLAPKSLYAYSDASYLFLDMCDQGSLLEAVNKANEAGTAPPTGAASTGLEEVLAVFFTIELLRNIEDFHGKGFVHGDLKIDNCLLRFEDVPGGAKAWSNSYDRTGASGWSQKGLKIIDFGRTIDTTLFPKGQKFYSTFQADEADCPEMRAGKSWTTEPDYYGLATIAFSLLFGGKMETKQDKEDGGRWRINMNFRRYHQGEMWTRLFDTLLNPALQEAEEGDMGVHRLRVRREEMEDWLETNAERNGKSLKALLRKMERWALERKR